MHCVGRATKLVIVFAVALLASAWPARPQTGMLASGQAAAVDRPPPWMAPLTASDRAKIQRFAASRERALVEAAGGDPKDLSALTALMRAEPQPVDPGKLEGRWRCRTFELGGIFPLDARPFFQCRIRREGKGLVLEKTTGSMHKFGRIERIDDRRLLYYGINFAAGDPRKPYGSAANLDEAGLLVQVGPDRLRLEIPEPYAYNSSHHDVVELVRAR